MVLRLNPITTPLPLLVTMQRFLLLCFCECRFKHIIFHLCWLSHFKKCYKAFKAFLYHFWWVLCQLCESKRCKTCKLLVDLFSSILMCILHNSQLKYVQTSMSQDTHTSQLPCKNNPNHWSDMRLDNKLTCQAFQRWRH